MQVQTFPGELQMFGDLQHCSLKRFLIALTFVGSVRSPFVKKCVCKNSGKELKVIQMCYRLLGNSRVLLRILGLLFPSVDHWYQLLQVYGSSESGRANNCWSGGNINICYCR